MCSIHVLSWRHVRAALFLLTTGLLLAGCGSHKQTGKVSGKVKYKGQPVTAGTVNFHAAGTGMASSAPLDGEGNYTFQEAFEVGTYKVYFLPPVPQQLPPGTPIKKVSFELPPKFQDPVQTPVSKEVKAGTNDFPIDLTN